MFQLVNRLSWIVCICLWLSIASIDDDLIFIGIVIAVAVKFFLFSPDYIRDRLQFFKQQVLRWENISTPSSQSVNSKSESKTDKKKTIPAATKLEKKIQKKVKEVHFVEKFFSENLLAKLGGILVFLGVLFFLSLIYSVVGPVTKLAIGFALGFGLYFTGVWLDKKWFTWESRTIMWVAILINYLVILSGRYLLGWEICEEIVNGQCFWEEILTVWMTFFLLILNTLFAVFTALRYNSRALLIFAFIFAYINPLLLGESSSEPYTLLGYTMIVTLWALYMSYKRQDTILFPLTFVLAATMFLIAPWSDGYGWVAKLLCINTLGALSLYTCSVFKKSFQHIFELLIGGTFFLVGIMGLLWAENLSHMQMSVLWASSLALMAFCYMSLNKWSYLYSIGTLGTILSLSPALYVNGLSSDTLWISVLIIATFALMNLGIVCLKTQDFLADNLWSIVSGLISGALFLTHMIYFYGIEFFPWVDTWFAFLGLSMGYFCLAFFLAHKTGFKNLKEGEKYSDTLSTISAIWVSIFSLAIAFIFAKDGNIVSIVWLLEATILFFLARKTLSLKIAVAGLILFVIGTLKLLDFTANTSLVENYSLLISFSIIASCLTCNLIILFSKRASFLPKSFYVVHNTFHIIALSLVVFSVYRVLHISGDWLSLLYFSVAIVKIWMLYSTISSPGLKLVHLIVYLCLMLAHIELFIDDMGTEKLNFALSILITIISALPFLWNILIKRSVRNNPLFSIFLGYLFIITSLYVYQIFDVTFAVTLYWGILSFVLLWYGINKNILYLRTIGLYLILLTAGKIFFYDIWMSVDDTISRVVALIVVGILMIVLSTMYTRKYGNNLNSEFNPSNLLSAVSTKE